MPGEHAELLTKLEHFDIDDRSPDFTFAARLARENGWSLRFAERVVSEYRRFVFLAATAGHPVTPSDPVDQAWHLHLTYSDSYRRMNSLLHRSLDHSPTRGGQAEDAKFADWYSRTLELYEGTFDAKPPTDIWPAPAIRFDPRQRFVRIDASRYWLVPKREFRGMRWTAAIVICIALLSGCSYLGFVSSDVGVLLILIGGAVLAFVAILSSMNMAARRGRSANNDDVSGSGPYTTGCGPSSPSGCSADGGSSGCSSGCGGGGCGSGGCGD